MSIRPGCYSGPLSRSKASSGESQHGIFLNNDMLEHRSISPGKADELRKVFKKSVLLIRQMLGKNAFKRYYVGSEGNPNGYWEPKKFNASLFDILMCGFTKYERNQVVPHLERLTEALVSLMTEDREFN